MGWEWRRCGGMRGWNKIIIKVIINGEREKVYVFFIFIKLWYFCFFCYKFYYFIITLFSLFG